MGMAFTYRPGSMVLFALLTAFAGSAFAVDRQIGVDAALTASYSQLTGGPPSPWAVGRGLNVGYWQRSSGAAQGVGSNNIATMEYQLPEVQPTRIRSAIFQFSGRAVQCSGDEPVVVDVFAYAGDGRSDVTDSTAGTRIATLSANCKDNPAFNKPIDVTHIVRQLSVPSGVRHVGFNVRKGNNRRGPSFFGLYPGKLNIVVADEDVAVAPGPVVIGGSTSGGTPSAGSQVDVGRVIGGLFGAAGTLLGGGGSKQAGNEAAAVLSNPPMTSADSGVASSSSVPGAPATTGGEVGGAAATSTAGVAASPSYGAAPVNVDIVGIKLGMTLDEVKRAVQAHSPGMRIDEQSGIINNAPATAYVSWIIAKSGKGAPAGSSDAIGVHFPPSPNAHRALFVERFTGFPTGQHPLADAIKEALVKKFGPPSSVRESAGDYGLLWTFNAAGVQIIDKSTQARCAKFPPTDPPARGQNILFNGYKSQGCGVTVYARIGRGSLNGPLSDYLSVSLIDDSQFEEIRQAAARFANQATRDTASKVAVPKL
ncbi:MAG: hypothetical protein ABI580_00080 [Burkholderiaceae bacterium]